MDESQASHVRAQFAYESWAEPTREEAGAPTVAIPTGGDVLRDWEVVATYGLPVEGARSATQAVLRRPRNDATMLRVDLIEMPTPQEARAMLLQLLGEFESPLLRRRPDQRVGDVAFEMPGQTTVLFARRNVVVMVRNAGPEPVPVLDAASEVDARLQPAAS
jgi:hypothetical protein